MLTEIFDWINQYVIELEMFNYAICIRACIYPNNLFKILYGWTLMSKWVLVANAFMHASKTCSLNWSSAIWRLNTWINVLQFGVEVKYCLRSCMDSVWTFQLGRNQFFFLQILFGNAVILIERWDPESITHFRTNSWHETVPLAGHFSDEMSMPRPGTRWISFALILTSV